MCLDVCLERALLVVFLVAAGAAERGSSGVHDLVPLQKAFLVELERTLWTIEQELACVVHHMPVQRSRGEKAFFAVLACVRRVFFVRA